MAGPGVRVFRASPAGCVLAVRPAPGLDHGPHPTNTCTRLSSNNSVLSVPSIVCRDKGPFQGVRSSANK